MRLGVFVLATMVALLSPSFLFAADPIVLGAEDAAGLWGRPDGTGCGNDIVKAAFLAAGVDVEIEVMPYARAKAKTLDGSLAGCFSMAWDASFEGKVIFAQLPLYTSTAVIFQNSRRPLNNKSVADFTSAMVLGTVRSYEYPEAIDALPSKGIVLEVADSERQNLSKLAAGRLTATVAMIDDLKTADYLIAEAGVKGRVEVAFRVATEGSYVGFSTLNPMGRIAKAAFDRGMKIIQKDGTLAHILAEWKRRL